MKSQVAQFKKSLKGKILFLGMGNYLRSDDAAGLVFLERMRQSQWASSLNAEFWSCSTSPENYLEKILKNDFDKIVIIDALHMNKEAGRIDLLNPRQINSFSVSTHSLSPKMFIDYLKTNKPLLNIQFLGIQPKTIAFKEGLSPEVSSAINKFIKYL